MMRAVSGDKLQVLLVGSGARESALAWKFKQSPALGELFVFSDNPWICAQGTPIASRQDLPFAELARIVKSTNIDLVVCGPEAPLAAGLADHLWSLGIPTFGPMAAAARLESSKAFAKSMMNNAGIPTAAYQVATSRADCEKIGRSLLLKTGRVVLKASGLASGKGVVVCFSEKDLRDALDLLYTSMASAATEVVVEEFLVGRECSFFVFLGPGGDHQLGFAVDYKRAFAKDEGPNTGGMGCYTPVEWLPADAASQVMEQVVLPLKNELKKQGIEYCGCLYVGLMWHPEKGPQVVEFNVRLGDPEAQILAVADTHDWLSIMARVSGLRVHHQKEGGKFRPTVGIVLASAGYPYHPEQPQNVSFAPNFLGDLGNDCVAFPASISQTGDFFVPKKGRILTLVASADQLPLARQRAYEKLKDYNKIWPNLMFRPDIAEFS